MDNEVCKQCGDDESLQERNGVVLCGACAVAEFERKDWACYTTGGYDYE